MRKSRLTESQIVTLLREFDIEYSVVLTGESQVQEFSIGLVEGDIDLAVQLTKRICEEVYDAPVCRWPHLDCLRISKRIAAVPESLRRKRWDGSQRGGSPPDRDMRH